MSICREKAPQDDMPDVRCELCDTSGGQILWQDAFCRVVSVADADYPGFCRVIVSRHVREMSDLSEAEQVLLMRIVVVVEASLRLLYQPDKINLASLGNVVPHLHWHVIPRWQDDRHFPAPIWASPQQTCNQVRTAPPLSRLAEELKLRLGPGSMAAQAAI